MADREDDIRKAIEFGGRTNGFDLLAQVAHVLKEHEEPSPALAAWFANAVKQIRTGASADVAFGVKRASGPHDPIRTRERHADRDGQILEAVRAAQAEGHPTSPNTHTASCFEVVAERLGLPEKTVRTVFYNWDEVEFIEWPAPERG